MSAPQTCMFIGARIGCMMHAYIVPTCLLPHYSTISACDVKDAEQGSNCICSQEDSPSQPPMN